MQNSDSWLEGWRDRWLISRTLRGDRAAFGKLYDRHTARVYNFLRRLTGNAADAEDLAQETFLAAYGALTKWRGEGAFSTWLCGIAFRQYSNARRGSRPTELLDESNEPAAPNSADPLAHCTRQESTEAMEAAIAALPEICREAFLLIRVEGMSYKEAAALLEAPVGTVQSRLWRATQTLQSQLAYLLRPDAEPEPETPAESPRKGANHVVR